MARARYSESVELSHSESLSDGTWELMCIGERPLRDGDQAIGCLSRGLAQG